MHCKKPRIRGKMIRGKWATLIIMKPKIIEAFTEIKCVCRDERNKNYQGLSLREEECVSDEKKKKKKTTRSPCPGTIQALLILLSSSLKLWLSRFNH